MARTLGKFNVNDLAENAYKVLGISVNRASNSNGAFSVNYTTLEQAKSNLINLIMTRKGERVHQPDFGCDIWKVLFEPIVPGDIEKRCEDTIIEAVNIWLPYLTVEEILLDYDDTSIDLHKLGVEINFYLSSNPNISGTITLNVNNQ